MQRLVQTVLVLAATGLLVACGATATQQAPAVVTQLTAEVAPATAAPAAAQSSTAPVPATVAPAAAQPTAAPAPATAAPAIQLASWQTIALTDARTGATFTLGDFAGRTVYIEPMATWCSNCRAQLRNVAEARGQLGEDVVFIALSVETDLPAADLAAYADANGFDWTFAVATPELLRELINVFGRTITNPPSTPHFVVRPDGTTTDLATGIKPAAEIVELLNVSTGS